MCRDGGESTTLRASARGPRCISSGNVAKSLSKTRRDIIEAGGRLYQILGLPRSTGQIYGLLYLSTKPLSLDDMVTLLGISKASASTGAGQLTSWGAIRQVWIQGDRRDCFEAVGEVGKLIKGCFTDRIKPRLASSQSKFEVVETPLARPGPVGSSPGRSEMILGTGLRDRWAVNISAET